MITGSDAVAYPLVAVAISKDKSSQNALKWAISNLVAKGQTITLIHVNVHASASNDGANGHKKDVDSSMMDLFLPFRCFCTRKDIHCNDVVLEDPDVAKAIVEYVSQSAIEKLVVGAPSKGGIIRRFKSADVASLISKSAPDFCSVYVISKEKVVSSRNAVRAAPIISPLRAQIQSQASFKPDVAEQNHVLATKAEMTPRTRTMPDESIKSPFTRGDNAKSYVDLSMHDTDISFVSSGRPSIDRILQRPSSALDGLDHCFDTVRSPLRSADTCSFGNEFSSVSGGSSSTSLSSQAMEDVEVEMRRLRLEVRQIMDMYNAACKEALVSKKKVLELHRWKIEEEQKLEEARQAEEAAMALVENEKAKCRAAMEAAEAQQRIAELEAKKRRHAEMLVYKEAEDKKKAMENIAPIIRYRRYSIDEIETATNDFDEKLKIGEGGYGPVYKCVLDHTCVAVKVLRPDAAQGRTQFQQEVEVLSCIRHPNMVLLLGACPEYGCLVYEYMANGSLEDRLFRRGNTPPIPWQHRFRIAAEIATGLLFLHQTKPEPLVHRDLKPGNILLDRNYISKISDVGLARLVPPSVADSVTQYHMTSTAGTFCYIDPEYQQTGMLGVKSDIYSLGIMLLQIITAKPPMGLTHHVSRALEKGSFEKLLDPSVSDWPVDDAVKFAQMALKCAELRRKDRPDLANVVLPELERLRLLGEDNMQFSVRKSSHGSPMNSHFSLQEVISNPLMTQSEYGSFSANSATETGRSAN